VYGYDQWKTTDTTDHEPTEADLDQRAELNTWRDLSDAVARLTRQIRHIEQDIYEIEQRLTGGRS
jgi:hypothetical protein